MKFAPVYSSSISQRNKFRMMGKIRFGRSLSEPLGLRSLIPSLAWLSVDELRAVVTEYPSAFQALSPPSSTNTFAIPRRRRASATRALVNSRGQEQYKTTSTSLGIKTLSLILRRAGAMRTAPGMPSTAGLASSKFRKSIRAMVPPFLNFSLSE
jgi:hypothetical protein